MNSIKEDIKILERIDIKYFLSGSIEQSNYIVSKADEANKAIEHILSDYKRVLKENEEKTTILLAGAEKVKQLEKENKDLKAENYELNNRITDLLENIPVQKIKDLMGEKEWAIKSYDCSEADYNQSQAVGAWFACQRLLEERKK